MKFPTIRWSGWPVISPAIPCLICLAVLLECMVPDPVTATQDRPVQETGVSEDKSSVTDIATESSTVPQTLTAERIVTRDLRPHDLTAPCPVSVDGVLLPGGLALPWHQIVGVSSQQDEADWRWWGDQLGRPWFLLRSRLQRGEDYGIDDLADQLLSRYQGMERSPTGDPLPSVGYQQLLQWLAVRHWQAGRFGKSLQCLSASLSPSIEAETQRQWQASYQLLPDWNLEARFQICCQIPPCGRIEAARAFLSDTEGNLNSVPSYRVLAAAAVDPQTFQAQLRQMIDGGPWGQSKLENQHRLILGRLAEAISETESAQWSQDGQLNKVLSELETEEDWGLRLICYWVAGRRLLQHTDRRTWMMGATLLMQAGSIQRQVSGGAPGAWETEAWSLVIQKYESVGEAGKVAILRRQLAGQSGR